MLQQQRVIFSQITLTVRLGRTQLTVIMSQTIGKLRRFSFSVNPANFDNGILNLSDESNVFQLF